MCHSDLSLPCLCLHAIQSNSHNIRYFFCFWDIPHTADVICVSPPGLSTQFSTSSPVYLCSHLHLQLTCEASHHSHPLMTYSCHASVSQSDGLPLPSAQVVSYHQEGKVRETVGSCKMDSNFALGVTICNAHGRHTNPLAKYPFPHQTLPAFMHLYSSSGQLGI